MDRKSYSNYELSQQSIFRSEQKDFRNKFVEIVLIKWKDELRLLGIHAPTEQYEKEHNRAVKAFFEDLRKYAVGIKETHFIIVGDLNVREGVSSIYLDQIHEIKKEGYPDEIKDGEITYFRNGHTIDHVLVSPALQGNVSARVIPQEEIQLSDHAVIIVDINI